MPVKTPSCLQCGKCCFVDLTAYAQQSDYDRWKAQDRQDILNVIEHRHLVWSGDRLISARKQATLRGNVRFCSATKANEIVSIYEIARPRYAASMNLDHQNCARNLISKDGVENSRPV